MNIGENIHSTQVAKQVDLHQGQVDLHQEQVDLNRELTADNARTLEREIDWFGQVLNTRMDLYFKLDSQLTAIEQVPMPDLSLDNSGYAEAVKVNHWGFDERLVLILSIIPHIKPQALDSLFIRNQNLDRGYSEFGGRVGKHHGGFLPTIETAAFVLAGEDIKRRFDLFALFESEHSFIKKGILTIDRQEASEPFFASSLSISSDFLCRLTSGESEKLNYSVHFPAKLITTPLSWQDLVLSPEVMEEINKIRTWVGNTDLILNQWGFGKSFKPGYRTLFYGPPGTGKTLTVSLLGKALGLDVYRVDLSSLVSKYIGETEKNLANLFDMAQNKNWILFFDEADALFGSRTSGNSANDRHSNQEIAYLLQRVEDFPGLVILASNLRANIDEAFSRRFQSMIYFAMPDVEQRLLLWQNILGSRIDEKSAEQLPALSEKYELAGGAIINVVRYGAICAVEAKRQTISIGDLKRGIGKELRKEGKTL